MVKKESLVPSLSFFPSGRAIERFRSGLESLFDDFFSTDWGIDIFEDIQPKASFPKVDVYETDDEYRVDIAVAGFNKDDVKLELKDNDLIISADKQEDIDESDGKYLKREISRRAFRRAIRFPKNVDPNNIDATYKDGIIKCSIKKDLKLIDDNKIQIEIK